MCERGWDRAERSLELVRVSGATQLRGGRVALCAAPENAIEHVGGQFKVAGLSSSRVRLTGLRKPGHVVPLPPLEALDGFRARTSARATASRSLISITARLRPGFRSPASRTLESPATITPVRDPPRPWSTVVTPRLGGNRNYCPPGARGFETAQKTRHSTAAHGVVPFVCAPG